jgi:hypothetical protein
MLNVGYILLQRIIRDPKHAWLFWTPYLARWIDLLVETSFAPNIIDYHGRKIDVSPGQYLTSFRRLGNRWHVHHSSARRTCLKFEKKGMIRLQTLSGGRTRKVTERATLITVVNWQQYQDLRGHDSETRTAGRTATRTNNKHVDNKGTSCSQANENVKTDTAPTPPHVVALLTLLTGVEGFEREAAAALERPRFEPTTASSLRGQHGCPWGSRLEGTSREGYRRERHPKPPGIFLESALAWPTGQRTAAATLPGGFLTSPRSPSPHTTLLS